MKPFFFAAAAALTIFTLPVSALEMSNETSKSVNGSGNFAPTDAPAPAPAPASNDAKVPEAKVACTQVTLALSAIDTKQKPASYSPTVRDNVDGLVDALKACNPSNDVVAPVAGSTRTARLKVTQGNDGVAYFKLPSDRLDRIKITFYVAITDWNKERAWGTDGTVGKRTELVMMPQDEKSFPKVSKE